MTIRDAKKQMTHGLHDRVMSPIRRRRRLHYFLRNLAFAPAERRKAKLAWRGCAARTLPIVMIIGCPRSGTSFAARMLHSAGLLLPGEHYVDEFNPEGYFEDVRVAYLNYDILRGSGGHWFTPPPTLQVYAYQRAQIVQTLAWLCRLDGVAGWKDPRATLTISVWLELASALNVPVHVVGVFRNPAAVVASVMRHEQGRFNNAQLLNAWCIHNTRLLELAAILPDRFALFTVDQAAQAVENNLNAIAKRIGLAGCVQINRNGRAVENVGRRKIDEQSGDIYDRLLKVHAAQYRGTAVMAPQKLPILPHSLAAD